MAWRPYNLLLITADGLRADYLGCNGHPRINSWYIDRLAKEGVRFNRCYTVSPMPGPSAVSLMSSTYPGEHQLLSPGPRIPPTLPTLYSVLREVDYRLGFFGQNTCLDAEELVRMFDEVVALPAGYQDGSASFGSAFSAASMTVDHPLNRAQVFADEAGEFMRRNRDIPFFAWLSLKEPAAPYLAPPPYDFLFDDDELSLPVAWPHPKLKEEPMRNDVWRVHSGVRGTSDDDIRRVLSTYMGMVRLVDDTVGRVMKTLEESGLKDNTVVVFTSAYGDLLGYRGLIQQIPVYYEGLTRVPAIIRHPEKEHAGSVYKGAVENIDLVPTVLDMLGMSPPLSMVGKNRWRDLEMDDDAGSGQIFSQGGLGAPALEQPLPEVRQTKPAGPMLNGQGAMIRRGDWKLSLYDDDVAEMYDLEKDPDELENLFEHPNYIDIRDELITALARKLLSLKKREISYDEIDYRSDPRANPLGVPVERREEDRMPAGHIAEILKRGIMVNPPERRRSLTASLKLTSPGAPKRKSSTKVLNQVLFVCTGNHYRSRFAEAVFNYYADILNLRYASFSRGLAIDRVVENTDLSPIVLDALAERTINPKYASPSRVQLTLEDMTRADRIIALDEIEHRPLMREKFPDWLNRIEYWDIRDIEHASAEDSLSRIEHQVSNLVRQLEGVGRD